MKDKLGKVHRVRALDGARLRERSWPAPRRRGALRAGNIVLSRFEIAIVASHRRAWRQFLRSGEPIGVILEDDAVLSQEFVDFVDEAKAAMARFDWVKLEAFGWDKTLVDDEDGLRNVGRSIGRLRSTHMGAAGYAVTRRGAERLLRLSRGAPLGVDTILFDVERLRFLWPKPRVGQVVPAPVIQAGMRDEDPGSLASYRQGRKGWRVGFAPLTPAKVWQEIVRPWRHAMRRIHGRYIHFR